MKYQHLGVEEREEIQAGLWRKESVRSIARRLGRSPASVSREITKNQPLQRRYSPRVANERALAKRKKRGRKLRLKNQTIRRYVIKKLKNGWSPEQIAGRMKLEGIGSISHEAIYQYIYARVYRGGNGYMRPGYPDLRQYLKRRHKKRAKKGMRKGERIFRPKGPSIEDRPMIVDLRTRIGDWESDTIASKNNETGLNSLSERTSGLLLLTKLKDKTACATREVITRRLNGLPQFTLTADNGPENQEWRELEAETDLDVYFAHPYCSGERGHNENDNGLVRWYEPKKTDFTLVSEEEIAGVEYALNTRPRKRLGYRTPLEVFNQSVALQG